MEHIQVKESEFSVLSGEEYSHPNQKNHPLTALSQ